MRWLVIIPQIRKSFHIHGLLDKSLNSSNEFEHDEFHEKPYYDGQNINIVQDLINEMIEKGNLIMINHPNWSRLKIETLTSLRNYGMIEIYNHQSEIEESCGYSVDYWDALLKRGYKVFGVASDDAHKINLEHSTKEAFGGCSRYLSRTI